MKRRSRQVGAIAACLLAVLTACGCSSSGTNAKALEGRTWRLAEVQGVAALSDVTVTARFEKGKLSGDGGENRYSGAYTLGGGTRISIRPEPTTPGAGPTEARMQEEQYLDALGHVSMFEVSADTLTLLDTAGDALVVFSAQSEPPPAGR